MFISTSYYPVSHDSQHGSLTTLSPEFFFLDNILTPRSDAHMSIAVRLSVEAQKSYQHWQWVVAAAKDIILPGGCGCGLLSFY